MSQCVDKQSHDLLFVDAGLCQNGGECNPVSSSDDAFRCDCLDGFTGSSCETGKTMIYYFLKIAIKDDLRTQLRHMYVY